MLADYLWNLDDATHTGTVALNWNDAACEHNNGGGMSINQADIDTNQGYFVGALFNRGANTRIN